MTNKSIDQIKQEIRERLLNEDEIKTALIKTRNHLQANKDSMAEDKARQHKKIVEELTQQAEEKHPGKKPPLDCGVYKEFIELTKTETWQKYFDIELKLYDTMLYNSDELDRKITDLKEYKDYVAFITDSKKTKSKTATADRIIKELEGVLSMLNGATDTVIIRYIVLNEKISKEDTHEIFSKSNELLNTDDKSTVEIKDHLSAYIQAVTDIKINERILHDALKKILELAEDDKDTKLNDGVFVAEDKTDKNKELYNIIPAKILNYPDNFTIADTEILNILTTAKYDVDLSVFKKSDETLNSLSHQDREILDYIVLTLYPNDQTVFSDYQIATGLYKEQAGETVSDSMLKAINDSIDRIRNVSIDEGFISAEKIGDIKAEVKINDHLITLRQINVKHENKTTWYRIIGDPFYYDYAVKTGKINHYEKRLISHNAEDKHIQRNIKNDTLKMMLTRRVISLNYYKQTIINMLEIYDILGISDARKYTDARKKAKIMLDDLQESYNFKYSFKKKGRTTTRLIIERYTDRPLEIKKKYS